MTGELGSNNSGFRRNARTWHLVVAWALTAGLCAQACSGKVEEDPDEAEATGGSEAEGIAGSANQGGDANGGPGGGESDGAAGSADSEGAGAMGPSLATGGSPGTDDCYPGAYNLVNSEGWVGGDPELRSDNPMCIQGAFYAYGDEIACPQPETNPCTTGSCCLSGSTIVDNTYEAWGCGLGMELNSTGGDNSVKQPYDGPADCFDIELSGDSGGNLVRVGFTQFADESHPVAPFVAIGSVDGSVSATVCFSDVYCPSWADRDTCALSGEVYDLQVQIVGGESDSDINLCLDSVTPLDLEPGGTGGTGGTGGLPPAGELPEDCSVLYRDTYADFCNLGLECPAGYVDTWCDSRGAGSYDCTCYSRYGYLDLELTGMSGVDVCAYVANLCADSSSMELEFDEPAQCALSYQDTGTDYCSIEQECTQSAEISDGVSVVLRERQYNWCELDDDAWTCSCNVGFSEMEEGANISFDLPASTEAADVCPDAMEICSAGNIELQGPRECSFSYQSASTQYCDAEQDCTRAGIVGDTEIQVHESLYASCQQEAEDEWSCNCGIGTESMSFSLSSADAWSTCEEASATCVEAFTAAQ